MDAKMVALAPAMVGLPADLVISLSDRVRELSEKIVEQERGGDLTGVASVTRELGYIEGKLALWVSAARDAIRMETELRDRLELERNPVVPPVEPLSFANEEERQRYEEGLALGRRSRAFSAGVDAGSRGEENPPFENGVHGAPPSDHGEEVERTVEEGLEAAERSRIFDQPPSPF